jgi:hypothetical protein
MAGIEAPEEIAIGTVLSRDQWVHSTVPRRVNELEIFWRMLAVTASGSGTVALNPTVAPGTVTGTNPNGGTTTGATNPGRKMLPLVF